MNDGEKLRKRLEIIVWMRKIKISKWLEMKLKCL